MSDNGAITWANEKRHLSQLIPWERNPRQIKGEQARRLQESWEEFGQPETIAIGPEDEVYNGHQRLKTWSKRFGDIEVDVRVASRALTEKEREKLTIFLHHGAVGELDKDKLKSFDREELLEWGLPKKDLPTDPEDENYFMEPELVIGPELLERHDYLIFYFDNELDWQVVCEQLDVKKVLGGQVGKKTLQGKGLGRVLNGRVLLELLNA